MYTPEKATISLDLKIIISCENNFVTTLDIAKTNKYSLEVFSRFIISEIFSKLSVMSALKQKHDITPNLIYNK